MMIPHSKNAGITTLRLSATAILCALFCCSCNFFEEEDPEEAKTHRFDFIQKGTTRDDFARETLSEEEVSPVSNNVASVVAKKLAELEKDSPSLKNAAQKQKNSPVTEQELFEVAVPAPSTVRHFYDDLILLNSDEELSVSLVFNNAPLLDVLGAFADVLNFNFVADNDLKGTVTLNINSKLTRKELFAAFERMLSVANAVASAEDSLVKITTKSKLAMQPLTPGAQNAEIYFHALKSVTAKEVLAQVKAFLSKDAVAVELTTPNAILVCDAPDNVAKVKAILEVIDRNAKANWKALPMLCTNVLPSKLIEELKNALPVLGFVVTKDTDRTEPTGAIRLAGVDRLGLIVVSAATQEALNVIRQWISILDSSDSIDEERVFVYKVTHSKASQLAQALAVIYETQGASLTIDTNTGVTRTDTISSQRTSSSQTTQANRNTSGTSNAAKSTTATSTDRNSNIFATTVKVFADGILNRLVIRTTPRTYASIKALLNRLDVVPPQVLLQVLVVEVTLTESTQFGLEFSMVGSGNGIGSMIGTNYGSATPDAQQEGLTIGITNPNDPANKFGYIRALAGNTTIKVLSSPQLLVSSNTEASINVGTDIPIITSGITNTSSDNQLLQNYTYKNTGIILTVTPQITSTDLISLAIKQELSSATQNTTSTSIDSPEINQRILETSMTIANGRTMIMGGLIQEKRNDYLKTIPLVNDIPFLRRLLGKTEAKVERSEILVMVTGYIVNEKSPVDEMLKRYNDAITAINDFEKALGDQNAISGRNRTNVLLTKEFWE
ncbi:MAG: secretin N-terminal domain-containing protein [Victivallaceae bacterium]|nr:secretin N-terminal domain-containing protein [Victivallaceae bacterium]